MNDDTILNPKTCRCVKKDGKIGKEILKNDKNAKYCKKDKFYIKDKTGNCIEKDPIQKKGRNPSPKQQTSPKKNSKQVSSKKENEPSNVKSVGPGIPKKFLPIVEDCSKNEKTWIKKKKAKTIDKFYLSVYQACYLESDDCEYMIKKQNDYSVEFQTEVEAYQDLQNTGAVPKIYAAWTCNDKGYIVMEKLEEFKPKNAISLMKKYREYKKLLEKIKEKGWLHVDSHKGNIMLNSKNKLVLIDFGWAVKQRENGEDTIIENHDNHYFVGKSWKKIERIQYENLIINNNPIKISIDWIKKLKENDLYECFIDIDNYNKTEKLYKINIF